MSTLINGRFIKQSMSGVQRFANEVSEGINGTIIVPPKILSSGLLGHFWDSVILPVIAISKGNAHIVNLCNSGSIFYSNQSIVLHDTFYEDYPEWYSSSFSMLYKSLIPRVIKSSKHIYTVSRYSQRRISEIYGINEEHITVLGNAVDTNKFTPVQAVDDTEILRSNNIPEKYLLFVGVTQERKNITRLLQAWSQVYDKCGYTLVVVGGSSSNFGSPKELEEHIKRSGNQVLAFGHATDLELSCLYRHAHAFCFVSLAEGFGIPVLEAMASGTAVISSNCSAIKEVADGAAILVDPYSVDEIVSAIEMLLVDEELVNSLVQKGLKRVRDFNWDDYARAVNLKLEESSFEQL
ncbi:glycosyltransferase family 1 protein [Ferrimonas pelagia]|uniref:Glycosyltransferase family 1 protein n=1 Tax=Ferrimonas pelagia TaxID=1177826 RepID=A0ABP9EBT9_9GAMM